MKEDTKENRQACVFTCEKTFVACAQSKPSGCVEALRVCKDKCPPA